MKLTRKQMSAIVKKAQDVAGIGRRGHVELGYRLTADGNAEANALLWPEDNDLYDTRRVLASETLTVGDFDALPNCATFDCYCYSVEYDSWAKTWRVEQLECNVYIVIKDGELADAHQVDLQADARCMAILGVPFSK